MSGRNPFERESVLAPLMLAPIALYMVLLVGFPFLMAFVYSFSNVTVGNPDFHLVVSEISPPFSAIRRSGIPC